jgi:hypothetical protein
MSEDHLPAVVRPPAPPPGHSGRKLTWRSAISRTRRRCSTLEGKPGNDQAFASGSTPYFTDITKAVSLLQGAGFGFGAKGKGPGKFYDFDQVRKHTQHRAEVHQLSPH